MLGLLFWCNEPHVVRRGEKMPSQHVLLGCAVSISVAYLLHDSAPDIMPTGRAASRQVYSQ